MFKLGCWIVVYCIVWFDLGWVFLVSTGGSAICLVSVAVYSGLAHSFAADRRASSTSAKDAATNGEAFSLSSSYWYRFTIDNIISRHSKAKQRTTRMRGRQDVLFLLLIPSCHLWLQILPKEAQPLSLLQQVVPQYLPTRCLLHTYSQGVVVYVRSRNSEWRATTTTKQNKKNIEMMARTYRIDQKFARFQLAVCRHPKWLALFL